MSLSSFTRKLTETLSEVFSNKEKAPKSGGSKYRKLLIDPLEERQMLAVSSVMLAEQVANTIYAPYISSESAFYKYMPDTPTISTNLIEREAYDYDDPSKVYFETYWGQESMAGNNQGDFVIVWSQNDFIVNPAYEMYHNNYDEYAAEYLTSNPNAATIPEPTPYLVNPQTQLFYDNWNVYARYFTDEMQRISLPDDITPNTKGEYRFSLLYAPYEVQNLTLTTAYAPEYNTTNANIVGTFNLGFDLNGDKQISNTEKVTIYYNELDGPVSIAGQIQEKLRALDPSLAEIEVTTPSANSYDITFYGDQFRGENVPELQVLNSNFTEGFLAGALMTTTSEPLLLTEYDMYGNSIGILLNLSDPEKTAASIQTAFTHNLKSTIILSPGVEYYSQERGSQDSSSTPRATVYTAPTITVRAVDTTTFDITFVDGSGKIDHQELVIMDAAGRVIDLTGSTVTTLKQNSTQFRVNDPEPDNPVTAYPEALSQMNATVAMDADGDFVITWQGEVRGTDNKITTNVYARRFSPQSYLNESVIEALEYTTGYLYSDGYTIRYEMNYFGQCIDASGNVIKLNDNVITPYNSDGTYKGLTKEEIDFLGKAMDADGNIITLYDSNGKYKGLTEEEINAFCGELYDKDRDLFIDPNSVGKAFADEAGNYINLYETKYKGLTEKDVIAILADSAVSYDKDYDIFRYALQQAYTNNSGNIIKLYQKTFKALTEREIEILCGSFYDAASDTFLDSDGNAIQDADENNIKLLNTDGTFKGLTEAEIKILCDDFYDENNDIFTNDFNRAIKDDDGNNIKLYENTYKPLTASEIQILCGSFYDLENDIFLDSNGNAIQNADGNDIKLFNANNLFIGLTEAEIKILCGDFYDENNDIFVRSSVGVIQDGYGNNIKLYNSDGTYKGLTENEVMLICAWSDVQYYQQYDFFVKFTDGWGLIITDENGNVIKLFERTYKELTAEEIEIICGSFHDKDKDIFLDADGNAIQDGDGKDIKLFNPDQSFKGLTEKEIEAICAAYEGFYDNNSDLFINIFGKAIQDDDGNDIHLLDSTGKFKGLTASEVEILCGDFYDEENDYFALGKGVLRDGTAVQGVRAVSEVFRVNTMDNGHQMQPAVGMDAEGNFVIAWSNFGQNHSYFSGIMAKWYDRDGNVISGNQDIQISENNTGYLNFPKTQPSVTLSHDGHVVIAWYEGEDQNYGFGGRDYSVFPDETQSVFVVYAPNQYDEHVYRGIVGGAGANAYNANVSFDANNRFLISYTLNNPYNIWLGETNTDYSDVYAESYQIETTVYEELNYSLTTVSQLMSPTLISALYASWWDLDSGRQTWAMAQLNAVGGFDADGDIVFAYQGYGPDFSGSSINRYTTTHYLYYDLVNEIRKHINENKNADLLDYFNFNWIPDYSSYISNDVDSFIRNYLVYATYWGANNEQLGRLNAVLESVYGMMRGAGNDIMTTRVNTGSSVAGDYAQSSDAVVNSTRDGSDTHFYIAIPRYENYDDDGKLINQVTGGNVVLRILRTNDLNNTILGHFAPDEGYSVNLPLTYNSDTKSLDTEATRRAWADILTSPGSILGDILAKDTGNIWPDEIETTRVVHNGYYSAGTSLYSGTHWEITLEGSEQLVGYDVYEIAFQHGAHDTAFSFYVDYRNGQSSLTRDGLTGNYRGSLELYTERSGYQGTEQKSPSIHVLPNGSYVVSWMTDSVSTNARNFYVNGTLLNRTVNYRVFKESQDQIGATKTDAYYVSINSDGNYVGNIARDADSANGLILSPVSHMVLTFDEELCTAKEGSADWDKSVLNPKLWVLLDADGNIIEGAIKNITFGMNQSMQQFDYDDMDAKSDAMFTLGSNKWEAVIEFNNILTDGVYTLVAKKEICDMALNELGLQGYKNDEGETHFTDGINMTQTFSIVVSNVTEVTFDHGDAPATYGDAYHIVNQNLKLGATLVAERVANYSTNANTDSDDDGLISARLVADEKIIFTLNVTNTTGSTAYLSVWIDVNDDGVFSADELYVHTVAKSGTNNYESFVNGVEKSLPDEWDLGLYSWVEAENANDDPIFVMVMEKDVMMRVRLTTDANIGPTGLASNGEVEDYLVKVVASSSDDGGDDGSGTVTPGIGKDYGSAPSYGTVSHYLVKDSEGNYIGPHLGAYVDAETSQREGNRNQIWYSGLYELSPLLWGDNAYGQKDDDGVLFEDLVLIDQDITFSNVIYACAQNNADASDSIINTIKVQPSELGILSLWIDYNGNGWFDDTEHFSERVQMRVSGSGASWAEFVTIDPSMADASGYVSIDIYVPELVGSIDSALKTFARFRFTDTSVDHTTLKPTDSHSNHFPSGTTPTGPASNGEVEDYAVVIITASTRLGGYIFEDQNYNGIHSETSSVPEDISLITKQGTIIPLLGESRYVTFDTMGISNIYSLGFEFHMGGFIYDQFRVTDQGAMQLISSSNYSSLTQTPGFTTSQGYSKYVATLAPFLVSFGSFQVTYSSQTYLEEGVDLIVTWTDLENGFSFGVHLRNSIDEEGKATDDGDFVTFFYNGIPQLPIYENTTGETVTASAEIGINFGTYYAAMGGRDYDAVVGNNALETQSEVDRYFNPSTYHWVDFTYDDANNRYYRTYRMEPDERDGKTAYSFIDFVYGQTNVEVPNMLGTSVINIYTDYSYSATWSDIVDLGFALEVGGARYHSFRISENGRIGLVNAQGIVDAYINVGASALQSTQIIDVNKGISTDRGNAYIQIRWNDAFGVYIENDSSGDIITFFWSDKTYHDLDAGGGRSAHNIYDISVEYANGTTLNIVQDVYQKTEYAYLRQYDKTELYGQQDFDTFLAMTGGQVSYRSSATTGFIYNNEPGIYGQDVVLFQIDENGRIGAAVARTQSDKNGYYEFSGLYPGYYLVAHYNTLSTIYVPTTHEASRLYYVACSNYTTADAFTESYDFGYFNTENTGTIALGDVEVVEGDKGDTYAQVPVYLTGSFGVELSLSIRPTTGGDALAGTDYRLNGPDYSSSENAYSYTFVPQVAPVGEWNYTQIATNTEANINQYERSVSKNTIVYEAFENNQWKVYLYYQPTDSLFCLTDRMGNTTNDRQPSVLETVYTTADGNSCPHIHITWSSYNAERGNYEIYYSDVILDNILLDAEGMQPLNNTVVPDFSDLAINWVCVTSGNDLTNKTDDINPKITSLGVGSNGKEDIAIVWTGHDSAGRTEVFYARGVDNITHTPEIAVTAVTNNTLNESSIQIHGRYILWVQEQSARKNIYLYDTTTGKQLQLTSAGINDNPVLGSVINASGKEEYYIAWESQTATAGSETYIELRKIINPEESGGANQIQTKLIERFNAPAGMTGSPNIGGEWLVWEGKQTNGLYHIYAYNFVTTEIRNANTPLDVSVYDVTPQNNASDNRYPVVFENRVVWQSYLTEKYGTAASQVIRYADLDVINFIPVTLSDVSNTSFTPIITESGMVVWRTQGSTSQKFTIVTANQNPSVVTGYIRVPIIGNTTVTGDREFQLEIIADSITKVNGKDVAFVDSLRSTATVTILEDDGYVIQDTNRNDIGGLDFGDAPESYGTLLKDDGARHAVNGYYNTGSINLIGANGKAVATTLYGSLVPDIALFKFTSNSRDIPVDVEQDAAPQYLAAGDNNTSYNDENGISFIKGYDNQGAAIYYGQSETVQWARNDVVEIDINLLLRLFAENTDIDAAYLQIWIDWNGDGIFSENTELVQLKKKGDSYEGDFYVEFDRTGILDPDAGALQYKVVQETLQITVPADAKLGRTYMRARISTEQDLGPNGWAPDGEVEDYCLTIVEDKNKDQSAYINNGILYIRGTELDDNITITRNNDGGLTVVFATQADKQQTFTNEKLISESVKRIVLDTRGGEDTVTVYGLNSDAENVLMRPGKATITTSRYVIAIDNAENITYDGNGGGDTVTMFDSRGNDIATLSPNEASIKSPGIYSNTVKGVYAVTMFSELGGTDFLKVTTNSGDTKGNAAYVHYIGSNNSYVNKAQGFAYTDLPVAAAIPASLPQAAAVPVAVSSKETELLKEEIMTQAYGTVLTASTAVNITVNAAQTVDIAAPDDMNTYIDLIRNNGLETVFDDVDVDAEVLALLAMEGSQQSSDLADTIQKDWLDEMLLQME